MQQDIYEKAVALRHELHRHPELSMAEKQTKARLIRFLQEHSRLEIQDRGNWFYAVYRRGPEYPTIALRADFDAVAIEESLDIPHASKTPGVSHKCGHDGHSAGLAALAVEIDRQGAEKNVFFLFQHAEETGQGAPECCALLREEHIDEIYCWHNMSGLPRGSVALKNGAMNCTSKGVTIALTGTPAHASQPEDGRNPAYAIAEIIQQLPILTQKPYQGLVLSTIVQVEIGQETFGISADKGLIRLTCRGYFEAEMNAFIADISAVAQHQAERWGLQCAITEGEAFPETANHPACADKVRQACQYIGVAVTELTAPLRGSEDFGYYLKEVPGAVFLVGNGEEYPPVHTFAYDFPDEVMKTGAAVFRAILDLK